MPKLQNHTNSFSQIQSFRSLNLSSSHAQFLFKDVLSHKMFICNLIVKGFADYFMTNSVSY